MNDSPDKIFLFQNPYDFGRALKKKNYGLTHLIEQTRNNSYIDQNGSRNEALILQGRPNVCGVIAPAISVD